MRDIPKRSPYTYAADRERAQHRLDYHHQLVDMSIADTQLPLRMQFGWDSLFLVGQQPRNTLKDMEQ
jgi:hypothetical protein